jgi:hypothetical protein
MTKIVSESPRPIRYRAGIDGKGLPDSLLILYILAKPLAAFTASHEMP